ncbi:MAG: LysE family translocator [Rhizobiaceae bacterium]
MLYSGDTMFYDRAQTKPEKEGRKRRGALYLQGFVTSIINPKAIIFFTAPFPQFINLGRAPLLQLFLLGFTYILVDGSILIFYGLTASYVADLLGEYSAIVKTFQGDAGRGNESPGQDSRSFAFWCTSGGPSRTPLRLPPKFRA